jgi:hypothetical protein
MIYSVDFAAIAQDWANSCPSTHNPNRGNLGENMFWSGSSKTSVPDAINFWNTGKTVTFHQLETTHRESVDVCHTTQNRFSLSAYIQRKKIMIVRIIVAVPVHLVAGLTAVFSFSLPFLSFSRFEFF